VILLTNYLCRKYC